MLLTKSDFLLHKECSSNAWFVKNKPDILTDQTMDPFVQGLIDQGQEVESWAQKKFPDGVHVSAYNEAAVDTTQRLIAEGKKTIFQATFSDGELYAMIDILQWNEMYQAWDIFEVKSSSALQDSEAGTRKNEHIDDAGFQRILLQRLEMKVANVYLMELNKEYTKDGPIDLEALFSITEITNALIALEDTHRVEIKTAYQAINSSTQPKSCECKYKPRKRHCSSFSFLYPDTPAYAVYDLSRIGSSKRLLADMVDQGVIAMDDIQDVSKFNKMKLWQWSSYIHDEEIILPGEIKKELKGLAYPLYFLDYETLPSAIPKYDGTRPHQQVVFQYSLHIIEHEGGPLLHKEYLHETADAPMPIIAQRLREDIGDDGSVIVWHKPFEVPRTKELAAAVPEHADFLLQLADRIYDLMDICSKGYYHHKDFRGSVSIKAVLPVMCPDLSYKTLHIQNGGQAMTTYRDFIFSDLYKDREDEVVSDLLAYCKLDTFAMVRIWEELWKKAGDNTSSKN